MTPLFHLAETPTAPLLAPAARRGARLAGVLLDYLAADEVLVHDAVYDLGGQPTIPDALRVDDHRQAQVAGAEAAGLGRVYAAPPPE